LFNLQSQSVFETARKDLGEVVSQAQKELNKFNAEAKEPPASEESASEAENDTRTESSSEADTPLAASTSESSQQAELSSSSLFTRLQSAFPPNIVSTVQNNIPETLKHATDNIDLAQLRATLSTEFHRVQDVTMAHAGQYVHKSEEMLREAMKEAGEVLKDAVKVIPPEDSDAGSAPGMVWDGTDIWMFPMPAGEFFEHSGKGKGKESSVPSSSQPSSDAQRAVATRAESLLKQLKRNPEIIKHDPESDDVVRELYATWVRTEVEAKSGGIEGEEWSTRVTSLLNEPGDGPALQASQDALGTLNSGLYVRPKVSYECRPIWQYLRR
jgi:ABC-type transporter MlaC component